MNNSFLNNLGLGSLDIGVVILVLCIIILILLVINITNICSCKYLIFSKHKNTVGITPTAKFVHVLRYFMLFQRAAQPHLSWFLIIFHPVLYPVH